MKTKKTTRWSWFTLAAFIAGIVFLLAYTVLVLSVQPSNHRAWSADQIKIPQTTFDGEIVTIQNVRNTFYRSSTNYDARWEVRQFDLRQLDSVWFIVEPFSDWRGPAHTFLSFGFNNGEYIAISIEIRKQKNETFSPTKGLLRQFELIYVVGDERDLIGLRANHRKDEVYLYKVKASQSQIRTLFTSMLRRANQLGTRPEFYNTVSNNCTSNIIDHIHVIAPARIPLTYKTYFPGYSDELAYDLGLIDTDKPRAQFRAAHQINALAEQYANSIEFSRAIRRMNETKD